MKYETKFAPTKSRLLSVVALITIGMLNGCSSARKPIYLPIPMVTETHYVLPTMPSPPKIDNPNRSAEFVKWCVVSNKMLTAELNACHQRLTGE